MSSIVTDEQCGRRGWIAAPKRRLIPLRTHTLTAMNKARPMLRIPVGGDCNCRCGVCDFRRDEPLTAEAVNAIAERHHPQLLVLDGPGEPLLRPDLEQLVHAARRGGAAQVGLITNGRALAYPKVAAAVASWRLGLVAVSLHHPQATVHDALVRVPGAHAQSCRGVQLLASKAAGGTEVVLRAAPHEELDGQLDDLAALGRRLGASRLWVDGEEALALSAGRSPSPGRSREGWVPARFHPDEGAVSLVIRTGCRNACSYCTTRIIQEHASAAWPLDDLTVFHEALQRGRDEGLDGLRMVALEPLEHPDLPALLRHSRALGYGRIEAWTSARALADQAWADELAQAGLTAVDIPLLGATAGTHDTVAVAVGSFEETVRGIHAALERFDVRWHAVVVRQNIPELEAMLAWAAGLGLGPPASTLIPAPSSDDMAPYRVFAPHLSELVAAVARLKPAAAATILQGIGTQIPPCVLEAEPAMTAQLLAAVPPLPPQTIRDGKLSEPGAADKLLAPCPLADRCTAAGRCPGIHTLYRRLYGMDEFSPLS